MRKLKICYLADAGNIHTQRWVKSFADNGHEVHLISHRSFGDNNIENVKLHLLNILQLRIRIIYLLFFPMNLLFNVIQVRRLIKRIDPDIFHAHYVTDYGVIGALAGFHPFVMSPWGSDILVAPKKSKIIKLTVKFVLNKADLIICDSETVKRGLLELGTNSNKIRKIFNGVDTQQFSPHQRDKELENRRGSREELIICVRGLRPIYNVEMLIKAIPLILSQAPEAKFIIGGDGEQRDYLKNRAKSLGVSKSITFVGWIPHNDLPKYLASLSIYVSTSLSDSTSLSLQEAMACELAPVVTDLPANREWVTDGENGFIVPLNDVPALASRIVYLLQNKEVRDTFSKASRKIIVERAEYKKEMGKVEWLYQELVKEVKYGQF